MEALVGVSLAALTVYDMAKGLDKGIRVSAVELLEKRGGKSGTWRAPEETLGIVSRKGLGPLGTIPSSRGSSSPPSPPPIDSPPTSTDDSATPASNESSPREFSIVSVFERGGEERGVPPR